MAEIWGAKTPAVSSVSTILDKIFSKLISKCPEEHFQRFFETSETLEFGVCATNFRQDCQNCILLSTKTIWEENNSKKIWIHIHFSEFERNI